jgi:hypothetical protein
MTAARREFAQTAQIDGNSGFALDAYVRKIHEPAARLELAELGPHLR